MAIASTRHTLPNNNNNTSSTSAATTTTNNPFLLPKNDLTTADVQLIDILLHGQNAETKIHTVNRWCNNLRRNRLINIVDGHQRYNVLLSLINTLQQTTNTEYQYNCLILLTELQINSHQYDQRIYLPAIFQCFSSTSDDVQILTYQLLIKQINSTENLTVFISIYIQDGLKSSNIRICIKSIEILKDFLPKIYEHEHVSIILELLLQYIQDNKSFSTYHQLIIQAIQHIQRILDPELLTNYIESYSPSLKRTYYNSIPSKIQNDETPRATNELSQIRDRSNLTQLGLTDSYSNGTIQSEKASSQRLESSELYVLIEIMRSKWMSSNETNRLNYLDQFKYSYENHIQLLRTQYSTSLITNTQFYQSLHTFFTSILDLLSYLTSSNIDLSIKLKLLLLTNLAWLIKHSQANFCKKNYKTICIIFKNILLNGESNNRQLAKLSVSLILLLESFVYPQIILTELIDDHFQYHNFRVQLELLAIVTATLIRHKQNQYDNLSNIYKQLLPMLISHRRELRHGALECFSTICSYFNSYQSITLTTTETNQSIRLILSLVDKLSSDASNALRFRLQRNLLPLLTDEGNITPGLICDSTTKNDPDMKYILLANRNNSSLKTPQSITDQEIKPTSSKLSANNTKLLQLAMPFIGKKAHTNDTVMRNREIPPLKPAEIDHDSHRYTNNNNQHYEASFNPAAITPGVGSLDFTVTGSNNYRPVGYTEKVFTDDWARKVSTNNTLQNESITTVHNQDKNHITNNNTLQVRPSIPRRSSVGRLPGSHNLRVTSQVHNHTEQKVPARRFDSDLDYDEGIGSAIDSRAQSNNAIDENLRESKPARSVHSSSTRRRVNRLFSNGSDLDSTSAQTLSEHSNDNKQFASVGHDTNGATKSIGKDQLFSTKPRLARSSSNSKLDKNQLPPANLSSMPNNDPSLSNEKVFRSNNSYVEVIGRGYSDERSVARRPSNETTDDKQLHQIKPRAKIIKGSVVTNSSNPSSHTNATFESDPNPENGQDIGVIGKACQLPLRATVDVDSIRTQNINDILNKQSDNIDIMSDEFDSDSKENENFADMGQSLSASFRLRVQQKTQEKIEQKERRRQARESRLQQQNMNNHDDLPYDNDMPTSSTSTSRYSSQPDLTALVTDGQSTLRRHIDPNKNSILPNFPSQKRPRVFKNSMARSQTFNHRRDTSINDQNFPFNRPLSEDRITDQLRNPDSAYREAMESIANDDWEQKCSGLQLIQLLVAQHPETITQNLHTVVLVLIQEVKNLRSQVARMALATFSDMFKYLKRNMDIELDLTVKALIQKSGESNEFFKSDAEKCLQTMIDNVTPQKALQALIAGGASHRNPVARKTTAKYIFTVCEKIGPTKILSGTRDITERVLQVAATFASDGPPEIRWYGKKIYHMLMSYDELDSMMKHHLNPTVYTNMCEILDSIRAKGGVGETPSESARNNGRRALSNDKLNSNGLTSQFSSTRKINNPDQAEQVRELTKQMRSSDFRERLNGIEEFQKLCELETDMAIQCLVQIFDGFNECLSDTNSKVAHKALNTMHQLIPILGDALSSVMNSALPLVAQNIASRNREISQLASEIIDTAIEYIDCGVLIQPLCTLSQNSNLRIRPEIIVKLSILTPQVCQRKPKQVEIHLLPTYWKLLGLLRGQNTTAISLSAGGSNSLNSSIHALTTALYAELGSTLIDKASSSSSVTPKNLQLLREICANIDSV